MKRLTKKIRYCKCNSNFEVSYPLIGGCMIVYDMTLKDNVGYINFDYTDDNSGKRNIEISYIFVFPKYRRMGVASEMISFLLEDLTKKGKTVWISLWTGIEIEESGKCDNFYLKNGFSKAYYQEDYYREGLGTTLFVRRIDDK